jgi:hypothetical protein
MFESLEMYEVTFEVYLEDKLIRNQRQQAPKEMSMIQFAQLLQQIIQDSRPMKLKMVVPQVIWDNFEGKQKTLYNDTTFSNNAMVAWEESKQNNKQEGENI